MDIGERKLSVFLAFQSMTGGGDPVSPAFKRQGSQVRTLHRPPDARH